MLNFSLTNNVSESTDYRPFSLSEALASNDINGLVSQIALSDQQLNGQWLKILNYQSFNFFRILTGCQPFSHSVNLMQ